MEILACSHCGKLFNYVRGDRLCPACQKAMNDHFVEVKKYVREHPNVDITTVSQEMKVSVRQIHRWICFMADAGTSKTSLRLCRLCLSFN